MTLELLVDSTRRQLGEQELMLNFAHASDGSWMVQIWSDPDNVAAEGEGWGRTIVDAMREAMSNARLTLEGQ